MTNSAKMIKSNKIYDASKYAAQVVLPALGTLYFAVAQIWGLPNANEVVGTIVAFDTFLGVVLHVSSKAYNDSDARYDGALLYAEDDTKKTFTLDFDKDPQNLDKQDRVVLRVQPASKTRVKVAEKRKRPTKKLPPKADRDLAD